MIADKDFTNIAPLPFVEKNPTPLGGGKDGQGKFQYIYGPVYSWRLGMSLGIDPLSNKEKICNLDCIYCQLGRTVELNTVRREYVPVEAIIQEIQSLPPVDLDHLTFSGRGEPTLAKNLGAMITALRKVRPEKIAVITNSVLIGQEDVQQDLALADVVLAKLDACDQETFASINKAVAGTSFQEIIAGIKSFRQKFRGRLALQIMLIDANQQCAAAIADLVRDVGADEIELNTPLRPSAVKPLEPKELDNLKIFFKGLPVKTVYELERMNVTPFDERDTIKRHGNYKKH